MKKVTFLLILFIALTIGGYASDITVSVDGTLLNFDVAPVVENGRTLVPLRTIFEALGADVDWNEKNQSILAKDGLNIVKLTIGSSSAERFGEKVKLDVPPVLKNGRTLVPLRFVSESLGADVLWDEVTQSIKISKKKQKIEVIPEKKEVVKNATTSAQRLSNYNSVPLAKSIESAETYSVNDFITGVGGSYEDKHGYYKEGSTYSTFDIKFTDIVLDFKLKKTDHDFEGTLYDIYECKTELPNIKFGNATLIKGGKVISSFAHLNDSFYGLKGVLKESEYAFIPSHLVVPPFGDSIVAYKINIID